MTAQMEAPAKTPIPRGGVILFDSGHVATWYQPGRCWMLTGRERAFGTEAELLEAVGAKRGEVMGWKVLTEPPTELPTELPTEPGLYRLDNGMVVELVNGGRDWMSPNHMNYVGEFAQASKTFTRLAPEAETAKRVLNDVQDALRKNMTTTDVAAALGNDGRRAYYTRMIAALEQLDEKYGVGDPYE